MERGEGPQEKVINDEVNRIRNINDAVADLVMAESVHQVVQTNYDRAAGVLDAFSKGGHPQTPDVAETPRSGITLTNRFGIHLPILASDASANPRVAAAPSINAFVASLLPELSQIFFSASYTLPVYDDGPANTPVPIENSLAELSLAPIDLLYLVNVENDKALTALDDYILRYIHSKPVAGFRPDAEIEIQYTKPLDDTGPLADRLTIFEVAPLLRSLRTLLLASRPLKATDIQLQNEASSETDTNCFLDKAHIVNALAKFQQVLLDRERPDQGMQLWSDQQAFVALFHPEDFELTMENQAAILNNVDTFAAAYLAALSVLSEFGLPQAGFGYIYDRIAVLFASIYEVVAAYKQRWSDKKERYRILIEEELDDATSDEEKIAILQKAERVISTSYTLVEAATTVAFLTGEVTAKKASFDIKFDEIVTFITGSPETLIDLVNGLNELKTGGASPLEGFDLIALETDDQERQIVVFAEDMVLHLQKLNVQVMETAKSVQDLLNQHDSESNPPEKVALLQQVAHLLFGEDFKLIPHFTLSDEHRAEIVNCLSAPAQDHLLQYQRTDQGVMFPLDNWLYSIARVREKLASWEHMVMHAEGFDTTLNLTLTPLQFPYQPEDTWLADSYPETYIIDRDKLLYTAYQPTSDQIQCGLLIDEWTEVIPTQTETTGLTFHYDQPNNEAPQSFLLVTTPEFSEQAAWQWQNLVDSLHETLDMARLRALEPVQIEATPYAQYLPATVSAVTVYPVTMALNYAVNNGLVFQINNGTLTDDG